MTAIPRIIAMDLDDTLLKHDLTISDRTVSVLARCAERGILPVLASGRAPEAMYPYAERIGITEMKSYIVANNGSQIITSDTRNLVYERFLPEEVALEAFRMTVAAGLSCHMYDDTTIYVSRETEYSERDFRLSGLKPVVPENFEDIIRRGVYKLVIPGHPDFVIPVEAEFKVLFRDRATVFVSKPFFMEVLPLNTGKGEALKEIAEQFLGISRNEVMAFGDSMNDESMISYAGLSVAMINSRQEILDLAKFKTDLTNDEDGIADFLEKNVLNS